MRFTVLLLVLLIPQALKAQFAPFESGSYTLYSSPTVWHESRLKLQGAYQLAAKDAAGKKTTFIPAQISAFRIGKRKYVAVGGFEAKRGMGGGNIVSRGFAEQLDSGQVILMRFEYLVSSPMMMNGAGGMSGGGSIPHVLYLLRRSSEEKVSSIPASWLTGGGEKFREALLPYLASRPDLTELLTQKRITIDNLPAVVAALNTDQPLAAK